MSIEEARSLIGITAEQGASFRVVSEPPQIICGRSFPELWTADLGPVPLLGAVAYPRVTAWTEDEATIGIGELLARWEAA